MTTIKKVKSKMTIETILLQTLYPVNPSLTLLSDIIVDPVGGYVLKILEPYTTNVVDVVNNFGLVLTKFFYDVWYWILYNVLTPILLLIYLLLFFAGQYYLIKLYVYVSKTVYTKIINAYSVLVGKKVLDNSITKIFNVFSR